MSARPLESCSSCGSWDLRSVLNLGSSPPTCAMAPVNGRRAPECHYPLELLVCGDCTLAQLSVIVDPKEVFPTAYPYRSGNSRALHENFADLAVQAAEWLAPNDLVVDLGANDGTLLSKFENCRTVGVEPTGQAARIKGHAYRAFFDEDLARRILLEHGPAKVITACNVLAHVEDIGKVMRGVDLLLADEGVLVAENHDLASVVDGGQWDTVYHEHLRFYSPYSFQALLHRHGLGVKSCHEIPTHGGSFRTVATRGSGRLSAGREYDFEGLAQTAAEARDNIRRATASGRLCGIGATARATTIINYCGLDVEDIPYVCEVSGSDKIGRYIPGTRIPVVDEAMLFGRRDHSGRDAQTRFDPSTEQPPGAVLFSWHLANNIVPKLRERGYRRPVTVPLPTLQYL